MEKGRAEKKIEAMISLLDNALDISKEILEDINKPEKKECQHEWSAEPLGHVIDFKDSLFFDSYKTSGLFRIYKKAPAKLGDPVFNCKLCGIIATEEEMKK